MRQITKLDRHEVILSSDCCLCGAKDRPIGFAETRTITFPLQCLFRAESAERITGIAYDAFVVTQILIGTKMQLDPNVKPRKSSRLLKKLRQKNDFLFFEPELDDGRLIFDRRVQGGWLDTCQIGQYIGITVRNTARKSLPFAIKLVGSAVF